MYHDLEHNPLIWLPCHPSCLTTSYPPVRRSPRPSSLFDGQTWAVSGSILRQLLMLLKGVKPAGGVIMSKGSRSRRWRWLTEPYSAGMGSNNVILIWIGHPAVDACPSQVKRRSFTVLETSTAERVMHSAIFRRPVLSKNFSPLTRTVSRPIAPVLLFQLD